MMKFSKPVRAELQARYLAKQRADAALADYLLGILNQLGIPPEEYAGFDDETGEILRRAAEPSGG